MVYFIFAIVVAVGTFALWIRLEKGWRARETPAVTRTKMRKAIAGVGLVVFVGLAYTFSEVELQWEERKRWNEAAERAKKLMAHREAIASELANYRAAIFASVRQLQANGRLKEARAEIGKYISTYDPEVTKLASELDAQLKEGEKRAKIAELESIA